MLLTKIAVADTFLGAVAAEKKGKYVIGLFS